MGKSWSLDGARVGMERDEPLAEIEDQPPLKIIVLGDFGGRGSQRNPKPRTNRALPVDRDNFEQVLQQLNVRLDEAPTQPNGTLGSVAIDSLDDFHPDTLLQRVAPLRGLRELRSRLAKRETFPAAMEEARGLLQPPPSTAGIVAKKESAPPPAAPPPPADGGSLLDQMLSVAETHAPSPPRRPNEIERLAQSVMAPYTVPANDPRQDPWLEAADQATAFALRQLLQHPRFRELEARWRSLDWLTRRINADTAVKIAVLDISEAELRSDLNRENLAESTIYDLLVTRPTQQPGQQGFGVIVLDPRMSTSIADIELLGRLSQIAADCGAKLLVGLTDEAVACTGSNQAFIPGDFGELAGTLRALRQLPDAKQTHALWPGVLMRQPYGKQSSEVESVELEELAGLDPQSGLLFGNSAYLGADQLIRQREDEPAATDITGLPCVILPEAHSGKQMVPAAAWWLPENALEHLADCGVTPVYPLPQAGSVRVFSLRSLYSKS